MLLQKLNKSFVAARAAEQLVKKGREKRRRREKDRSSTDFLTQGEARQAEDTPLGREDENQCPWVTPVPRL